MINQVLRFVIDADASKATAEIKRADTSLKDLGTTSTKTGDQFSVSEKNFLRVSKSLGVDLSTATGRQIEKLEALRTHIINTNGPASDLEKVNLRLAEAQAKYAVQLGETTTKGGGVLDFLGKHQTAIGIGLTSIGAAITGGLGMAVAAFGEAQKGSVQLDAALASTKGAAGLTRQELDEMAKALARATTFDDDAITRSQSIMLTFGNVTKENFGAAMQAALDLSARLGIDLQSAVMQVGKALEEPEKGMTALRRSGISFNEEQKNLIKTLVDTGDVAGAQKVILGELATAVGGSATAATKGFAGQWMQLQNEMGNVVEEIGGALVPMLAILLTAIKPTVQWITDFAKANPKLTTTIIAVTAALGGMSVILGPLLIALPSIITLIGGSAGLAAVFTALTGPVGLAVVAIGGLVAAGVLLYENSETVRDIVKGAWSAIEGFATDFFGAVDETITDTAQAIFDVWEEHKNVIVPFIKGIWNAISGVFEGAFTVIEGVLTGGLKIISGIVETWAGIFTGDWEKFTGGLSKIWSGLWTGLSGIVKGSFTALEAVTGSIWNMVTDLYEAGQRKALGYWYDLWNALAGVVSNAWNKLKSVVEDVTSGVTGAFQNMYDVVVGQSIVPDLMDDIGIEFGRLDNLMGNATRGATGKVTGLFSGMVSNLDRLLGSSSGPFQSLLGKVTGKLDSWIGGLTNKIGGIFGTSGAGGMFSGVLKGLAQGGIQAAIGLGIQGIQALFGKLFGPDKNKLADTELVQRAFPEIWRLHGEYQRQPFVNAETDRAIHRAYLSQGIEMWNELTRNFKRPESRESQRPGILQFIDAINKEFANRTGLAAPSGLPVQPMAAGGIVTRPTVALIGERGPEAVVPLGSGVGGITIQSMTIVSNDPQKWAEDLKRMVQNNRGDMKRFLKQQLLGTA